MMAQEVTTRILINEKSKWYSELVAICNQGYSVSTATTIEQALDVMILMKPKKGIICVVNGADLLFKWKRNEQVWI